MADGVPFFKPADDLTGHCTAIVVGQTFVDISANVQADGAYSVATVAAGAHPLGVAMRDGAIGDRIPLMREGVLPVIAGAILAAGQEVMADAAGKAIPWVWAANGANVRCGKVLADCANGAVAQIAVLV